jgi:hypothetical protein
MEWLMDGADSTEGYLQRGLTTGTFKAKAAPRKIVRERWKPMPISSS